MSETIHVNPVTVHSALKPAAKPSVGPQIFITAELPTQKTEKTSTSQTQGSQVSVFIPGPIQSGSEVARVNVEDLLKNAKTDFSPATTSDDLGTSLSEAVV